MSFRMKATILLVAVSLVCALCISAACLQRSSAMNADLTLGNSRNAFYIIHDTVRSRLNSVSRYYESFIAENVGMYLTQYRDVFVPLGVFVQLNKGPEVLYSTFADPAASQPSLEAPVFFEVGGTDYLAIRQPLDLHDGQSFELTLYWNVQHLRAFRETMLRFSAIISALSIPAIGIIGFTLIRRLTRPFRALGEAARRFAGGEYADRVNLQAKDEIGRFAQTFNLMADAIERQIQEMDELVRDRERFIDHLSHEIRTPITAMIGYSQALKHAKATEADKQKAAEYIGQQSTRLKLLSEKLLSLSRLRYDTIELKPVSLSGILHAALKTLREPLLSKSIRVENSVPDIRVMGDAALLETLFQNLIENAVHASPQGGKIELAGEARGQRLTVTIRDYGMGISAENLDKITEPFMRLDAARSRKHGGVGIGLALCKRICEIHHTGLAISSAPGEGTKIEIDFTIPS